MSNPRGASTAFLTDLSAGDFRPAFFVRIDYDEGSANLWTGHNTITTNFPSNSTNYLGAGELLGLSSIGETNDLSAVGMEISLSGINTTLLSRALTSNYNGRQVRVWIADADDLTHYAMVFSGKLDTMVVSDTGETSTMTATVENDLIRLMKTANLNYTEESHRGRATANATDTFMSYVQGLQDTPVLWGKDVS